MFQSALEVVSDDVFKFIAKDKAKRKGFLVKKHSEHLDILGDLSFPNKAQSWHGIITSGQIAKNTGLALLNIVNKRPEDFVEVSKQWLLPIKTVKVDVERVYLFLSRPISMKVGLAEGLKNTSAILENLTNFSAPVNLDPLCEDDKSITSLRLNYLSKSVQNLYALNEQCKRRSPKVFVSSKSSSKSEDGFMVLCGTVLNAKTGVKECNITANNFVELRQNEMTLIAQHKYGVRVSTETKWKEFIAHLGESAVIFELLQTKPSSAVKINFDLSSSGCSKGASFILYNCARLETILRTYNDKVNEGTYPQLPDLETIDLTLLNHEDEWILVYNFILGLPNLINSCVDISCKKCEFKPHHICSFLNSMVRVFSQYYRKIRILTEPRKHLLPVLYARLHMLVVLNDILKVCLRILNIKSVSQM